MMREVITDTCFFCGKIKEFYIDDKATLLRECVCSSCGASIRNSDIIKRLTYEILGEDEKNNFERAIVELKPLRVLNLAAQGKVHEHLKMLPGYYCGEFFDDVASGTYKDGTMCINLEKIPFADGFFDLIITEDVLEHVTNIDHAFKEINRVLKIGGKHIFTVPVHEKQNTVTRLGNKNKVYHGDPIREGGSLVVTDFGIDLDELLLNYQMRTACFLEHRFHSIDEVSYLDEEYDAYFANKEHLFEVFRYNSFVFVSEKFADISAASGSENEQADLEYTGERYVPGKAYGEIIVEHLQRYEIVKNLVKGKVVLDAASGEGYGSALMAEVAASVHGIDISRDSVEHANEKYAKSNLEYTEASIDKLPYADNFFDVVVSFETIEHVNQAIQKSFLAEIKRVLKEDGILIMSTPDKNNYSNMNDFDNQYHIKEFYFKEFQQFLLPYFEQIRVFRQGEINIKAECIKEAAAETGMAVKLLNEMPYVGNKERFIIAICGNHDISGLNLNSMMFPPKNLNSYVYIDSGAGFTDDAKFEVSNKISNDIYTARFTFPSGVDIRRLRFDPLEGDFCSVALVCVHTDAKNLSIYSDVADAARGNIFSFMSDDPQIIIDGDFAASTYVELVYRLHRLDLDCEPRRLIGDLRKAAIEKELRNQEMTQIIKAKDDITAEMDRMIKAKDDINAEKDRAIAEMDRMIRAKDDINAEKDSAIHQLEWTVSEKDRIIAEKDKIIEEKFFVSLMKLVKKIIGKENKNG